MSIPPDQLAVIKDNLLLYFIMQRGGTFTMTYDDLLKHSTEFDGWSIFMAGNEEKFTLKVMSPERMNHEPTG